MPRFNVRTPLLLAIILLCLLIGTVDIRAAEPVPVTVFWGIGCPYCDEALRFLDALPEHLSADIQQYEVWYNTTNRRLWQLKIMQHNVDSAAVPMIFIGDDVWVGFNDHIGAEIVSAIEAAQRPAVEATESGKGGNDFTIAMPWGTELDAGKYSLVGATALIAFVDGFNPCSLWVLLLLLGLVMNTKSRKKTALVGLAFLITTALVYGGAMLGLIHVLTYIGYLRWIQIAVALLALVVGLVNVKDFFWFGKGFSFSIPERYKPGIYANMRRVMSQDALLPLLATTVAMAVGIALIELPCTAGFPIIWSNLLVANQVPLATSRTLLALYLLIYLLDELIVFFIALVTLEMTRLQESQGRQLKLIGGTVMITLAVVMFVNPGAMNNIGSSMAIFAGAILVAWVLAKLHGALAARKAD